MEKYIKSMCGVLLLLECLYSVFGIYFTLRIWRIYQTQCEMQRQSCHSKKRVIYKIKIASYKQLRVYRPVCVARSVGAAEKQYKKATLDRARRRCRAPHQYFNSRVDTSKKKWKKRREKKKKKKEKKKNAQRFQSHLKFMHASSPPWIFIQRWIFKCDSYGEIRFIFTLINNSQARWVSSATK